MKARRWKAPNDPTPQARQVWAALFPAHAWPARWRCSWAGFMRGAYGLTSYSDRRIFLSYGDARRHHRVAGRCKGLRHGAEFLARENSLRARLGFDPSPTWYCS